MTKIWSHLPNAAHIDRVLADVSANPKKWSDAYDAAWSDAYDAAWSDAWDAARSDAYDAAWSDAWDAAWNAARGDARSDAWDAAWNAARGAAWDAARNAAKGASSAVLALIAYDDCAHLLDGDPEDVKLMALLGSDAAILLYPACVALNKQMELA